MDLVFQLEKKKFDRYREVLSFDGRIGGEATEYLGTMDYPPPSPEKYDSCFWTET